MLDVTSASRRYGSIDALRGVDLKLRSGQILALLGKNGAGKTTLFRGITGRLKLDSGEIRLHGADPRADRHARKRLGVVPQSIALYPHLTAAENLEVFARLAGMRREQVRERVDTVLAQVGLSERAATLARTLSGGMQRRLNIAAGVLHQPSALLLDEPSVGVDPQARSQIHELLMSLRQAGIAILLTTHDLDEAELLADRIAIMVDGAVVLEGEPQALVAEAFGGAQDLSVTLEQVPDAAAARTLSIEGLSAGPDPRRWSGRLEGGLDSLSSLRARLRESDLQVTEVRVREPGLRGVFFQVAGEDLHA